MIRRSPALIRRVQLANLKVALLFEAPLSRAERVALVALVDEAIANLPKIARRVGRPQDVRLHATLDVVHVLVTKHGIKIGKACEAVAAPLDDVGNLRR